MACAIIGAATPMKRAGGLVLAALLSATCSGSSSTSPAPPAPSMPAVLVGAGDIGDCATRGSQLTAQLLAGIPGTVFTAGDNAYPSGTAENFRDCYQPDLGAASAAYTPIPWQSRIRSGRAPRRTFNTLPSSPVSQGLATTATPSVAGACSP